MAEPSAIAAEIEFMKAELGVNLDRELAQKLGIDPSAVAAWRRRGAVPAKYRLSQRRAADERMIENDLAEGVSVTPSKLREAYIFALLDIVAGLPVPNEFSFLPTNWYTIWRGARLANAHMYFQDIIPTDASRDDLRRAFETTKAEIANSNFLEWLETL